MDRHWFRDVSDGPPPAADHVPAIKTWSLQTIMASPTLRKTCALLLSVLFLMPYPALAQSATLTDVNVTNSQDDLMISLKMKGAFNEELKNAIMSGVPATFSFYIDLYRVRDLWLDKEIVEIKQSHTIKYDSLKKEFIVRRSWRNNEPEVTPSFEEAQQLMSQIDNLKIVLLSWLEKGERYQIKAKAEVSKLTLPFYLHYVLLFVSLWDIETDWYTVDLIY